MEKKYWIHTGMLVAGAIMLVASIQMSAWGTTNGVPRDSIFATYENLGDWGDSNVEGFRSYAHINEQHLIVDEEVWDTVPSGQGTYWGRRPRAWTANNGYRNFSASMQVKQMSGDASASGCLMVRADDGESDSYDYDRFSFNLCISSHYGAYYWWNDESEGADHWESDFFVDDAIDAVMRPLDQWNTLKIVAKDETIWMFLNDKYIGATRHFGPNTGGIGLRIDVEPDTGGHFAFRNLEIRRLGWI